MQMAGSRGNVCASGLRFDTDDVHEVVAAFLENTQVRVEGR